MIMVEKLQPEVAFCLALQSLAFMSEGISREDIRKIHCFDEDNFDEIWQQAESVWNSHSRLNDVVNQVAESLLNSDQRFSTIFNLWDLATADGTETKDLSNDTLVILELYTEALCVSPRVLTNMWIIDVKNLRF